MTRTRTAATISAVYIVKNEEDVLAASLDSVGWVDQIVVYDTGSTDSTREIARRYTDLVIDGYWDNDFAAARNRALAHATGDWVLSIDADEVLECDPDAVRRNLGRGGTVLHTVIVTSTAEGPQLPLAPLDRSGQFAAPRVFLRRPHVWRGQIHEEPLLRDPAPGRRITPLPDTVLHHGGYTVAPEVLRAKGERNLAIAEAHLARGIEEGAPPEDLELRRVHVVRSAMFAGRVREAVDLASTLLDEGLVVPRHAVILAPAVHTAAELLDGPAAGDRWLDVWETHDSNPAAARLARARAAARRGDAESALAAVEGIPTTTLNFLGERVDRAEVVPIEVWALSALGRGRHAMQTARAAAAKGVAPGSPSGLLELLGPERCTVVIEALTDGLWRQYATACVMDASRPARSFLSLMHSTRPGDAAVLAAVAMLTPALSLEEASEWSVAMRAAGAAEHCPLVTISHDENLDPRQRAVAGALAYSAYGDSRGLSGLEAALARVPAEHEAELLGHLEIVAPGLVTPGLPA